MIDKKTIQHYDVKGPRYTSYPVAPEWKEKNFPQNKHIDILSQCQKDSAPLSLYIHIPYCESLCYFCACSMIVQPSKFDEKSQHYLNLILKEIDLQHKYTGHKEIAHLHLGGGTPNFFSPTLLAQLVEHISKRYTFKPQAELSIELDPRHISKGLIATLKSVGFNRASLGIQDFDPKVQKAVNRIQPLSLIEKTCAELKQHSIPFNFDLIYGLPHQNFESFTRTIQHVIDLHPQRIALYSFAYLPHLKKHHRMYTPSDLPSPDEKINIFLASRQALLDTHYVAIGIDHFTEPQDPLAAQYNNNKLYRNFMGYTLRYTPHMIGIGYSAISSFNDAYIQNTKNLKEYEQKINANQLPSAIGHILSKDDKERKWCIDQLMCHFGINKQQFSTLFQQDFDTRFKMELKNLQALENDKLISSSPQHIAVSEKGKFFTRNIAMVFDASLQKKTHFEGFSRTI